MTPEELTQAVQAAVSHPDTTIGKMAAAVAELVRRTRPAGRPFSVSDAGVADGAGAGQVTFAGPAAGQVWYLERVAASASGASAAGVPRVYIDTVDEVNLVDAVAAMQGNTPSRAIHQLLVPFPVWAGVPLIWRVTGAVAGSLLTARISGHVVDLPAREQPL